MASLKTRPLANVADVASWFLALVVVVVGLVLLCSLRRDQLPARDGRHRKRACDEAYVVGEGETLHTVSDKCGDPFLVERNPHIHDPDDVFPGLVIKLALSKPRLGRARRIQGRRTRICMNASLRCDHTPVNHEACRKISVCYVRKYPFMYAKWLQGCDCPAVGAVVDKPMGATDRKRNKWFVMGKPVVSSSKPRSHLFPRWAHGISGKEPSPPNQPSVETRSTSSGVRDTCPAYRPGTWRGDHCLPRPPCPTCPLAPSDDPTTPRLWSRASRFLWGTQSPTPTSPPPTFVFWPCEGDRDPPSPHPQ
ncbi:hypothetical protein B296_00058607 [Ensete ventricosum]|uniref:LysM domain-containing protein n=1 Tax=Ensete ventricosum TaxID=4639 RepID=A0A426X2L4_ENSVE|nr:hypothetical protein B296_00058607 [Ensete ventricosum]